MIFNFFFPNETWCDHSRIDELAIKCCCCCCFFFDRATKKKKIHIHPVFVLMMNSYLNRFQLIIIFFPKHVTISHIFKEQFFTYIILLTIINRWFQWWWWWWSLIILSILSIIMVLNCCYYYYWLSLFDVLVCNDSFREFFFVNTFSWKKINTRCDIADFVFSLHFSMASTSSKDHHHSYTNIGYHIGFFFLTNRCIHLYERFFGHLTQRYRQRERERERWIHWNPYKIQQIPKSILLFSMFL